MHTNLNTRFVAGFSSAEAQEIGQAIVERVQPVRPMAFSLTRTRFDEVGGQVLLCADAKVTGDRRTTQGTALQFG